LVFWEKLYKFAEEQKFGWALIGWEEMKLLHAAHNKSAINDLNFSVKDTIVFNTSTSSLTSAAVLLSSPTSWSSSSSSSSSASAPLLTATTSSASSMALQRDFSASLPDFPASDLTMAEDEQVPHIGNTYETDINTTLLGLLHSEANNINELPILPDPNLFDNSMH
jgi:hypothetical protein